MHILTRVLGEVEQLAFAVSFKTTPFSISFVLMAADSFKTSDNGLVEGK